MKIKKVASSSKTIRVDIENSDNYYLDLNQDIPKEDEKSLYKLYTALDYYFKKKTSAETVPSNQTNIIDQINEGLEG